DSAGWLEIAIANAFGERETWTERLKWATNNRDFIKDVIRDPGLIWRRGLKVKEPFQFVAACFEYVAAETYGPQYDTHLPIWLDASSNGLQHLAMMGHDKELAAMVNLNTRTDGTTEVFATPDGEITHMLAYAMNVDFAREIPPAARAWRRQKEDVIVDVYRIVLAAARLGFDAARDSYWLVRSDDELRAILKQPIMTLPYGVTKNGML